MPSKHCRRCRGFVHLRTRFDSGRRLQLLQLIGILFLSICCTNPPQPDPLPATPPPVPAEATFELPQNIDTLHPAVLMKMAFAFYERGYWNKAVQVFRYAIGTGQLNDMGRAVAYWHIADACEKDANSDCAAEAYMFFSVVGEDLLHPTDWQHNPVEPNIEFIENFGLRIKLDYAIDYINVLWDSRTAP